MPRERSISTPLFLSQIDGKKRAERDGEFLTFNPFFSIQTPKRDINKVIRKKSEHLNRRRVNICIEEIE